VVRSILARNMAIQKMLLALMLAGIVFEVWTNTADAATTFIVNKTGDAGDKKISDTVCDASRQSGKQCTLRAAIQEANDTSGADTINFNIGGTASVKAISPSSPLPEITDSVTIDGYTQPGARANTLAEGNDAVLKIQLIGTNAGRRTNGLQISAANSAIKGLVISRFEKNGILVAGTDAMGNSIEGNFIGTDTSGTARWGNINIGVLIGSGASTNTVGGREPEARNLISGNGGNCLESLGGYGVKITNSASGNFVQGNYIGTDKGGASVLKNCGTGVWIEGPNNTVGGTVSEARNVISGNGGLGLSIDWVGQPTLTTGNKVVGNYIGTDASGTHDLGNGDYSCGVGIFQAPNTTIGGTASGAGNLISGNSCGVDISNADGNEVKGNTIRDNAFAGVRIWFGDDNTVGGTGSDAGNQIFNNGDDGVFVEDGTGNRILSNSIFSNDGLGIDLDGEIQDTFGVTANDADDSDGGSTLYNKSNRFQNFPVISSATRDSTTGTTSITGTLNSNPSQTFTIQCFVTEAGGDPSGHGEGQTYLAETTTATDSGGDSPTFTCTSNTPAVGDKVTMTATNTTSGDTSEFSANVTVTSSS
jgi:parallel beta-helix repeat protein